MHVRALLLLSALTAGLTAGALACIPDPNGDFADYAERANATVSTSDGGGNFDSGAPATEGEALYYGACMTVLSENSPDKVFNFYTQTKFVPNPAGGGSFTLAMQPLKVQAGPKAPATVSTSLLTGTKKEIPGTATVAADGRYTIALGEVVIPGDANPISGREVVLDSTLQGFFGQERFCAQLGGKVARPISLPLDPAANICLFVAVKDGDPTPALQAADFVCPY